MRIPPTSVCGLCLFLVAVPIQCLAQLPKCPANQLGQVERSTANQVFYTGQLDGLLGSRDECAHLTFDQCRGKILAASQQLEEYKSRCDGILVGAGDNFGQFGFSESSDAMAQYVPQTMIVQRLTPDYSSNPIIDFVRKAYNAVVPGKEDFAWGVEYLRRMTENEDPQTHAPSNPVPLIANNLVIQAYPDPVCHSYPTPTTALPLLPNQVSSPITSSAQGATGAGGGTGASGGGGSGSKGKGKGGGGKGGGTAAGGAAGATSTATGGGVSGGACPGAGGAPGSAGATTPGSVEDTFLTRQQKALLNLPRPTLRFPDASAVYPWTFSISLALPVSTPVSGPKSETSTIFKTETALLCPATSDPSQIDTVKTDQCITWSWRKAPARGASGGETYGAMEESASPTKPSPGDQPAMPPMETNGTPGTAPSQTRKIAESPLSSGAQASVRFGLDNLGSDSPIDAEGNFKTLVAGNGIFFPGNLIKACLVIDPGTTTSNTTITNTKTYRCTATPIAVQRPLFQRAWIIANTKNANNNFVILGALASDTLNGVSDANKDWAPTKPSATDPRPGPTMQVSVGDPAAALSQALTAFNLLHPDDPDHPDQRFTALVLGQMTVAEAKNLADSLGSKPSSGKSQIKMILSAADPVESTPQATITVPNPTLSDPQRFIPVISPAPVFKKSDCLRESLGSENCVATAQFAFNNDSTVLTNTPAKHRPTVNPASFPNAGKTFCDNDALGEAQRNATPNAQNKPKDDNQPRTTWECEVLRKMKTAFYGSRSNWNPEIVILESSDFDYLRSGIAPDSIVSKSQHLSPDAEKEALKESEALWNAGNLTRVALLGSTLTTILNQVRSNQTQSYQSIASVQQARQLRILGILQKGQTYFINGMPLDATKLYSVATSDNLATTASDYGSIASVDQNPPEIFWNRDKKTMSIADIVYQADKPKTPTDKLKELAQTDLEAPFGLYGGKVTETDRKQGAPQLSPFALLLTHSNRTIFSKTAKSSVSEVLDASQLGPLWHIAIQQLSVGFTNARPSQNDQLIGTNLGGVSNPNVVSPHSDTLTAVEDARVEKYFARGFCRFCLSDAGADLQFNFSRSIQGSTTPVAAQLTTTSGYLVPTTSVSYPANTYLASPFLEFQIHAVDYLKPILRPAFATANVASLKQFIASGDAKLSITPNLDFELAPEQTVAVGEGAGLRFEANDFTYAEFGLTWQRTYNVLSAVSAGGSSCLLNSATSLSTCAGTLPAVAGVNLTPSYSAYKQEGGYMLASWTQELPRNPFKKGYPVSPTKKVLFVYQATAFGNFFAYGRASTSSALTRYAFALENALQIQLPANFSFGPSYNLFYFQANEHNVGSSLHRSSINAQFSYFFDWHNGLPVGKSILGKEQ